METLLGLVMVLATISIHSVQVQKLDEVKARRYGAEKLAPTKIIENAKLSIWTYLATIVIEYVHLDILNVFYFRKIIYICLIKIALQWILKNR